MSPVVVLLDRSLDLHGGDRQDRWAPARDAAVALAEELGSATIVVYDDRASVQTVGAVADMIWSFLYGSNLADGLAVARRELGGPGSIKLVTYSAPSSCTTDGHVFFDPKNSSIVREATLAEVQICADADVRIDVLLVGSTTGELHRQIADMTKGQIESLEID